MGLVWISMGRRILVVMGGKARIRRGSGVRAEWLTGGPRVTLVSVLLELTKVNIACCLHS